MYYRNKELFFLLLVFGLIFLHSCKKSRCAYPLGDTITQTKTTGKFKVLETSGSFDVMLIQDSLDFVEIQGPEGNVNTIEILTTNDVLLIEEKSKCEFLRSYDYTTTVRVHFSELREYRPNNSGKSSSLKQIKLDSLTYEIGELGGTHEIDLSCNYLQAEFKVGTGNVKMSGSTSLMYLFNGDFAKMDLSALKAEQAYVNNAGYEDLFLYVTQDLGYEIFSIGDIVLRGSPNIIYKKEQGEGLLIRN